MNNIKFEESNDEYRRLGYEKSSTCYENGFGVRKDYKKAIEMYGKAVENGEKAGLEAIKRVYLKMNVSNSGK